MRPDQSLQLGALHESLSTPTPLPAGAGPAEWTAWMARIEADAALAGLITRVLNQGTVSEAEVSGARALTERAGSSADPARVAAAYDLLLDQAG